ncbi:MAG TPA: FliH/SctL family protein, partial [bacterium]|nr:FliH/SctL family protein [bacterium]
VEAEDLNQQAELRYQEAQQAKDLAEQEAAQTVARAHAEADGVREQAYQEGREAGRQEGMRRRYEEAGANLQQLEHILEEMSQMRRRVNFQVEKDGVRLAVLLAKKILRQELQVNRKAVLTLLARTLAELEDTGTFRVWMNSADLEFALAARKSLEKFLGEDQTLSLRAKPDLAPGNVQIESDREVIDLTIESQLHHLDALLTQALNERESVVTRAGATLEGRAPAAEEGQGQEPGTPAADEGEEAAGDV